MGFAPGWTMPTMSGSPPRYSNIVSARPAIVLGQTAAVASGTAMHSRRDRLDALPQGGARQVTPIPSCAALKQAVGKDLVCKSVCKSPPFKVSGSSEDRGWRAGYGPGR
jgi:hypothetical protein